MKFKKLLAVTLSAAMMFTVPAYANEPEAIAVYQELEAKSQNMSDMNAIYDYHVDVSGGGLSMDTNMQMSMQANNLLNPDLMKMNMDAVMTMGKVVDKSGGPGAVQELDLTGVPITYNYYYENGMYYIDMMGSKVKYPMPLAEAMKAIRSNTELMDTGLEYMHNLTLRTEGENRILSYTLDTAQMNELVQKVLTMSGMAQMTQTEGVELTYREISGEYTIRPDGYYTNAKMSMVADMQVQGQEMTMDIDLNVELINPGQPVEVKTPNLAEYQDAQSLNVQTDTAAQ